MDIKLPDWLTTLKQYLPLVLVFTSVMGGVGQFIHLTSLSPSLLAFFSTSDVLVKGVFLLFFLMITTIINTYVIKVFNSMARLFPHTYLANFFALIFLIGSITVSYFFIEAFPFLIITNFILGIYLFAGNKLGNDKKKATSIKQILFYFAINSLICTICYDLIFIKYNVPINLRDIECDKTSKKCYKYKYHNDKYVFYTNKEDILILSVDQKIRDKYTLPHPELEKQLKYDSLALKYVENAIKIDSIIKANKP